MLGATAATLASGALARALPAIAPGAQARLRAAIDDAARKAIAAKAAPGFSVAVALHGQILLQQGFGLANLETQTAITPRSIFRIGSLTKQFTAAAMARLQEQGRLKLVDPVAKYLPAFGRLPQIAINELIHHTAGLHSDDETASPAPGPEPQSQAALANAIAGQKKAFDFAPGTAWLYSNANYIVLGAIVEQVTAEPFADAIRNLVLKPLMPTTLAVDRSDLVVPGRTSGYSLDGERFANAPYIEISEAGGAGSMRGDAPDLVLWHQALIAGRIVGTGCPGVPHVARATPRWPAGERQSFFPERRKLWRGAIWRRAPAQPRRTETADDQPQWFHQRFRRGARDQPRQWRELRRAGQRGCGAILAVPRRSEGRAGVRIRNRRLTGRAQRLATRRLRHKGVAALVAS